MKQIGIANFFGGKTLKQRNKKNTLMVPKFVQ